MAGYPCASARPLRLLHLDGQMRLVGVGLEHLLCCAGPEGVHGALGIPKEKYEGYLQLRMFGSVPHAGFGMDLERLVMFATGLENIREAIPFPRSLGHAE